MIKSANIVVFEREDLEECYLDRPLKDIRLKHLKKHGYANNIAVVFQSINTGSVLFKDNDGLYAVLKDNQKLFDVNKIYTEQEIKEEIVSFLI